MKSLDTLLETLKNHPDIKRYQEIENTLMQNEEIKDLLDELKHVQKQLVHAQNLDHSDNVSFFQKKLDDLKTHIHEYPLMSEYMQLQQSINEMLKTFTSIIEEGIENQFKNIVKK